MNSNIAVTRPSLLVRKRPSIGLVFFAAILIATFFVQHSWPEETAIDFTLDTVGYALLVLGVFGRLWSTLYIGGKKHVELQCEGPYRIVRHPLYVSSLLIALGFASLSENPIVVFLVIVYFTVQYTATIRHEEKALRETFGEAYDEYARQVPRFLPRFHGVRIVPPASIDLRGLRKELTRGFCFFAVIPLMELLALLHEKGVLPFISFP